MKKAHVDRNFFSKKAPRKYITDYAKLCVENGCKTVYDIIIYN